MSSVPTPKERFMRHVAAHKLHSTQADVRAARYLRTLLAEAVAIDPETGYAETRRPRDAAAALVVLRQPLADADIEGYAVPTGPQVHTRLERAVAAPPDDPGHYARGRDIDTHSAVNHNLRIARRAVKQRAARARLDALQSPHKDQEPPADAVLLLDEARTSGHVSHWLTPGKHYLTRRENDGTPSVRTTRQPVPPALVATALGLRTDDVNTLLEGRPRPDSARG